MEALELKAQVREEKGKGHAARLRREGQLPCVLYGSEIETLPLTVNTSDLERILKNAGPNALIKVKVGRKEYISLVRDIQTHPVNKEYLHADLQQISLKEKLQTTVPLQVVGESPGVRDGGMLQQAVREIEVECLPTDIPDSIEVDISELAFGDSIFAGDLKAGPGVEILAEPDMLVISVVAPQAEEEPAEAAGEGEAEAEAPAGEAAEPEQPEPAEE